MPRGGLRVISAVWLSKYLDYINALSAAQSDSERMVSNIDSSTVYNRQVGVYITKMAQIFVDPFFLISTSINFNFV